MYLYSRKERKRERKKNTNKINPNEKTSLTRQRYQKDNYR